MEDKPHGNTEQQKDTRDSGPPPFPSLAEKKEGGNPGKGGETVKKAPGNQAPRKPRWERFKTWIWPMDFSDAVMLVLTAAIALGTIVSAVAIFLQWREMVGGGTQTDRIIAAADGIEMAQGQLVSDNKQVLADNRQALSDVLRENREELARALGQNRNSLQAQTDAANGELAAVQRQTEVSERPWIRITPRIVEPLTFNVGRNLGLVATMTTENVIENVGPSVALNVLSWEDVIPTDPDGSLKTARARQEQWCGAHRFIQKGEMSGSILFPHNPTIERMGMGPLMTDVNEAAAKNALLPGKVAFVLVGCVCYRSSFEPITAPGHQTRFIYWLGIPADWGGFQPNIDPSGVATELRLIQMEDGFTAD